jgi:hypothetical protein
MKRAIRGLSKAVVVGGVVCASAILATGAAFAAVAAHLTATPVSYVGVCPGVITFNGKIQSTTQGIVKYKFTRSDGAIAPVQTLIFHEPGIQSVSTTWTLGGIPALPSYVGWEAIQILSPVALTSNHANFKLRCIQRPAPPPGHN